MEYTRFKRKPEKEVREEFEKRMENLKDPVWDELVEMFDLCNKEIVHSITQMRKEGLHVEADEAQRGLEAQKASIEKKMSKVIEEKFQQYLSEYNKFADKMEFIQNAADEAILRAGKALKESVERIEHME